MKDHRKKAINENYFDKESKSMYYVLGAFYAAYLPRDSSENGIMFRSKDKNLVQIVKDELESEHEIINHPSRPDKHDRNSYFLHIYVVPHLRARLSELGLDTPKEKRTFPNKVDEKYLNHFIRGFFDAKDRIRPAYRGSADLCISFNRPFLKKLHSVLMQYANVQSDASLQKNTLSYDHKNSMRIHDFIYRDMNFIKKHNLYVPSQKKRFNTGYVPRLRHTSALKVSQRIEEAKKLMLGEVSTEDISKRIGYAHSPDLHRAFKGQTGQTIVKWRREHNVRTPRKVVDDAIRKIEKVKKLMLKGASLNEAERQVGYSNRSSIYAFFKKHTGETPGEWRRKNGLDIFNVSMDIDDFTSGWLIGNKK